MKKILFLFCFLPILGFGQSDTIAVDSISIIKYDGSRKKKSIGYETINKPKFKNKIHKEKNPKSDSLSEYPNYNEKRDMPLPVAEVTIMDKNNKFHPSAKWETCKTFHEDSVTSILEILSCKVPVEIEKPGMCFSPGLGILVWSKGEIVTFYSVCFHCNNVVEGGDYPLNFKSCIDINLLKSEVLKLGY